MVKALIVLILFSDPSAEAVSKALATGLAARGGDQVGVVVGAEAVTALTAKGLAVADLAAAPEMGKQLTKADPSTVLVRVDVKKDGDDTLVELSVTFDGKVERTAIIAGKGGDPAAQVQTAVIALLAAKLPAPPAAAEGALAPIHEPTLPDLAAKEQWQPMLGVLAGIETKTPRDWYYQVMAYARLGRRDAAVESLDKMKAAFPGHFLVAAAEELVPPPPAPTPGEGGTPLDLPGDVHDPLTDPKKPGPREAVKKPAPASAPAPAPAPSASDPTPGVTPAGPATPLPAEATPGVTPAAAVPAGAP